MNPVVLRSLTSHRVTSTPRAPAASQPHTSPTTSPPPVTTLRPVLQPVNVTSSAEIRPNRDHGHLSARRRADQSGRRDKSPAREPLLFRRQVLVMILLFMGCVISARWYLLQGPYR